MDHNIFSSDIKPWNFNWTDFCPTGLTPWTPNTNDLSPCFQQLFLQFPILTLLAILSSYHFGKQGLLVVRNLTQIRLLYVRAVAALLLGFIPVITTYQNVKSEFSIYPVDILLSCTECVTWIVHMGYILSLRSHGNVSNRGHLSIAVLWTTVVVLSIVWLRTEVSFLNWIWPLVTVILHIIYGVTLVIPGSARIANNRNMNDERQRLIDQRYYRYQDFDESVLGPAQDNAGIFSSMVFQWVAPLINKGVLGYLKKIDDLFDLPETLFIARITDRFQKSIDRTTSLFRALHRTFGKEFYSIGLLRFLADLLGFAGPLLLGELLKKSENSDPRLPYLYALGLFSATLVASFCSTHFNWRMSIITMKMRTGLVTAIYRKTLEAKELQNGRSDILNLMSTDTDRIVNSCASFHSFWSIPFQLFTTLYLLYTQIGAAFLAGVIFAVALIPINRYIAVKIGQLSQSLMEAKDTRVTSTAESLSGAKQVKLHAWENVFINKISTLRHEEIIYLKKRKYLDALCVYFWATTPVLMSLLTFGVSALLGNTLSASSTFTSIALLNMLIGPLNAFPWVLNGLTEAWVSLKRVQKLMNLSNVDLAAYYSPENPNISPKLKYNNKQVVLSVINGCFEFLQSRNNEVNLDNETIVDFKLNDVNMEILKGDLVAIVGIVGSGKSALIQAILGNLICTSGQIYVQDLDSGFGYVSQTPWLQRGTIRENILWGSVYDETKYNNIIFACGLQEDLIELGGDHKGVGEAGRTLSGGQRARLDLARCVYQEKQIYILDDVLSALDAHIASHVVKHCILGLLKNKTRIIVSEHKTLLRHANQIYQVENGTVIRQIELLGDLEDDNNQYDELNNKMINITLEKLDKDTEDTNSVDSLLLNETKEFGKLSINVLSAYWNAVSSPLASIVLISVVLMQASRNISDIWLAHWVSSLLPTNSTDLNVTQSSIGDYSNLEYYLGIYFGLAMGNSIITLARAFLFAYAGVRAAKFVHTNLLASVFYTKFQFFDVTPLGRLLNRFSSDTYTIDDTLPFILNILLAQFSGLIGSLAVSLYAMPWLALLVIPMCPVYINVQNRYRCASRDIKRLSSNALSPLYIHFTETLLGLPTIRAMRGANRFRRNFSVKLEESVRSQLTASAGQQWLGLRLQILGSMLVGGAGLLAAITSQNTTNPTHVGLAISYALSITNLLSGLLNALAETEQELVAVERVIQYCDLEKEINYDGSANPPFGWPCQGVVTFKDVFLRYRDSLPPILAGVSFETHPCETVGIVGRTGAGKTSILSGIFRVVPVLKGTISIDCVDIMTIPLSLLRSRISIVPQDPFLFKGTVRENLDPQNSYTDTELWSAINTCLSTPLIQSLGGLNAMIDTGGLNLSAGQRQLLCLTRALLKNSKIVFIDEGTANLDSESEIVIQSVLKTAFKSSTVLLIAHRLNGLQHANRIIVMAKGNIAEQGNPKELASDTNSMFSQMLKEQLNFEFRD